MDTNGPIVCATDLSPGGARAVDLAASAARDLGAALRLVHVTDTGVGSSGTWTSPAQRALEERVRRRTSMRKEELEAERARAAAIGITVEDALVPGRPWEAIVGDATARRASLVVVGPHGEGGPAEVMRSQALEWLLGITADRVIRHAPCPVLVASRTGAIPALAGGRWLVATDFEPCSRAALALALRLAARCGASVTAVHAIQALPEVPPPPELEGWSAEEEESSARAHLEQLATEVRSTIAGAPAVASRVVRGDPASTIAQLAADLGSTLIVIGTHGRTGLAHGFLGSVAERVLRRATVPVLVSRA